MVNETFCSKNSTACVMNETFYDQNSTACVVNETFYGQNSTACVVNETFLWSELRKHKMCALDATERISS